MRVTFPVEAVAAELGCEIVTYEYDPNHDRVRMTLLVDGAEVRRALVDDVGIAKRVRGAVRDAVDRLSLEQRYRQRPRPRLGAGTVGGARRKR